MKRRALTFIEILVVLSIIGVLVAILLPAISLWLSSGKKGAQQPVVTHQQPVVTHLDEKKYKILEIDGCEYVGYDAGRDSYSIAHKGDCKTCRRWFKETLKTMLTPQLPEAPNP